MRAEFWKNKRVLITGHTGFKGSWLCMLLDHLKAEVVGISLPQPVSDPCLFNIAHVKGLLKEDIRHDIIDYPFVKDAISRVEPEIVIHMAAQPIVKDAFADPLTTYGINTIGTANILEACKQYGKASAILAVTTDKVYGDTYGIYSYRETDKLRGSDPYSTSKACAELIVQSYRTYLMGDMPVASARAGNVVGGGDFAYRLVPMVCKWLSEDKAPVIWDPNAVRPWQHVLDCLAGYMTILEHTADVGFGEDWNVGPVNNQRYTCFEVARILSGGWKDIEPILGKCPDTYPVQILLELDSSKLHKELKWKNVYTAYWALRTAGDWYRDYYLGVNMSNTCKLNITNFLKEYQGML